MLEAGGINLSSTPQLLAAIFGVIVIVAAAVAVARTSYLKAQIEGLRGDRDDQAKRIDRQDIEIAALELRSTRAEARASVLEDVVTGRKELESLTSLLAAHDRKTDRRAEEILTAVREAS